MRLHCLQDGRMEKGCREIEKPSLPWFEYLVKRNGYIEKISKTLSGGKTILLYGHPGIGKTVIASNIAHQVSKFFLDGVLWYQLSTSSVMDILASIAEIFGHNVRNI